MSLTAIVFWLCAALVVYALAIYPLLLGLLARFRERPVRRPESFTATVSLVVAAHNEQERIEARLRRAASLLAAPGLEGEVILVSDGSTDGTAEIAQSSWPARARDRDFRERRQGGRPQPGLRGGPRGDPGIRGRPPALGRTPSGGSWRTSPIRPSARSAAIWSSRPSRASPPAWACTGATRKRSAGWSRAYTRCPA